MKAKKTYTRFILPTFGIILTLVCSVFLTIHWGNRDNPGDVRGQATEVIPIDDVVAAQKAPAPDELKNLKTLNILLLGYGGAGHQGGFLTDVIQLLSINLETKKISLISIPRDLWVELPNGKKAKINQAFTLGDDPDKRVDSGAEVSKHMAEVVTGLKPQYYIAVDFVGLQRLIGEELGGITVNVPETLEDPWYPIRGEEQNPCGKSAEEISKLTNTLSGFELEKQFECRYEHIYFEQGKQEMQGGDVLAYVRSRHGSTGGDFSRSKRQYAVLLGIRDKILSLDGISKAPELFEQFLGHVNTDLDLAAVKYLVPVLESFSKNEVKQVVLSTDNVFVNGRSSSGQFILEPKTNDDWQSVREFLEKMIGH